MDRRQFLTITTATAATVGFAGCSGGGDDNGGENGNQSENGGDNGNESGNGNESENGNESGNGDDNGTAGPPAGQSELVSALTTLVGIDRTLTEIANPENERSQEDLDTVRTDIETARGQLDEAESAASDGLGGRIEAARSVASFQEAVADDHAASLDAIGTFNEGVTQTSSNLLNAENPSEASDSASSIGGTFSEAVTAIEEDWADARSTVQTQHGELDTSALGNEELDYSGEITQYVRYSQDDRGRLQTLATGYNSFAAGVSGLFGGRAGFETERWEDAENAFNAADEEFQSAQDALNGVVDQLDVFSTDLTFEGTASAAVEEVLNVVEAFSGVLSPHIDAAETAVSGDIEAAQQRYQEASSQLQTALTPDNPPANGEGPTPGDGTASG